MEHLISAWPRIAEQLRSARRILLLTDYDGTLTPIVERPELANLTNGTRQLLQALAHQRNFTVGLISGRSLADLKDRVRVNGVVYAGNHGLEIEGPEISFVNPVADELRPALRVIHYVLSRALGKIRGVLVENKGLSLSVHYRLVDSHRTGEVRTIFQRIISGAQGLGKVRITAGKKVYEVRPAVAWDKGKAVKLLMKKYGKGGRTSGLLPMYFGDDMTDEDGFKVIEDYGNGISVFVGEPDLRPSAARYFVKSPEELVTFFKMLLQTCQEPGRCETGNDGLNLYNQKSMSHAATDLSIPKK